jgi:hypothetical protein
VEEQKYKDEEIKIKIYETYSKYHDDPSSDRRQVHLGQVCGFAFKWCRDHLFYGEISENEAITNQMGLEILMTVERCLKKNKMSKEEFLPYLKKSLDTAKIEYYRKQVKGSFKEPRIIKEFRKIIENEKKDIGRKLRQDECVNCIRRKISMREKTILEHLKGMDRIFIKDSDDDDKEITETRLGCPISADDDNKVTGSRLDHSHTAQKTISVQEDGVMEDYKAKLRMDSFNKVLDESQGKMKDFYREIFTLYCIKRYKKYKNYKYLLPILDGELLKKYEESGKKPTQVEIYKKYHPDAEKETASANASEMINKFKKNVNKIIEKEDPECKF